MAKYQIGDSVLEVNSNRHGKIVSVGAPSRGRQSYEVLFVNADATEPVLELFLQKDFDISDPFERCLSHKFGSFIDFARINTSYKIENSSNSTIASLKASKTMFKAYQFKPLLKFLNSENHRLLVADEVGLGKTIEAGHIMLEMLARKELRNVLIVCPKSLRYKWKSEMEEKFNIKFRIYDSAKDFEADIKMRNGSFRGIINYERIQAQKKRKKEDPDDPKKFINIIKTTGIQFSLVLCDEAHKMRNSSTATYKGAEVLSELAKSMVFLTATPIMISDENLYSLLHLMAPIQYDNSIEFHNNLSLNQPFLQALRELRTTTTLPEIASELKGAKIDLQYRFYSDQGEEYYRPQQVIIDEFYRENPLYQRCIHSMTNNIDTKEERAKLQYDLTSMSELNSIFSRTRRRDITTDWTQAERHPHRILVDLHPNERETFDQIIEEYIDDNSYIDDWTGEEKMYQGAQLGLVSRKRQVASSVYAYLNEWEDLEKGIDRFADEPDAKVDLLNQILKEIFEGNNEKKIIIFAIFRKTLQYLRIRLEKAGYKCAMIYGGLENRDLELARFKKDDSIQILLSSEVGSEGLDMQFCCSMVNYDLPWNPMVVEQRIGRIDRFGQQSPVVKIFNLVVTDSIQEDIYDRLLMRIGIFQQSIGDLEAILDANYNGETIQAAYTKLEKDLFYNKLSEEERISKMDDIAQAIANEQQQLQKIEESQTNTLTVDTYFQNEVNRILTTHAYLTDSELRSYIELLIKKKLPICSIESIDNGCDLFIQPKANSHCLFNFITQYLPDTADAQVAYSEFKRKVNDRNEFIITFKQEVAYENPDIIYVNNSHPIIQAALNYFKSDINHNDKTFLFDVPRTLVPEQLTSDSYFLAIYSIGTSYVVQGAKKDTTIQYPILYDWRKDEIITNEEVVMKVMGQSQVYGQYHSLSEIPNYAEKDIQNLKYALLEKISYFVQQKKEDLEINLRSQQNVKLMQLEKFHTYQEMARLEEQLRRAKQALEYSWSEEEKKNAERTIKATETRMQNAEQEYQDKRFELQRDFELNISSTLISINLINLV